jgi:flagellar hook-associated protein 1 FlgK
MVGLFGTLNIAARSLSADQEGTAVAGQNLANVNNPGYAREQLVLDPSTPIQTPIGQEGTGVTAAAITEARSALLDGQITSESSVTGSLNAQQQALQNAQTYLNEQIQSTSNNTSPSGLTADLSNLFNAFQSLSTDPGNLAQRQSLVQSAQQLASQFNQVSSQLQTVSAGLNTSIQNDVNGVNQDLATIAGLNQQIVQSEASGGSANVLVDQREQAIEDLAGKVNITTSAQSNGSVNISIGGVGMFDGASNQRVADGLVTYDSGGGNLLIKTQYQGIALTPTSGSIQGEIETRDGALAAVQSGINTLASQLITQVNSVYSAGYDMNGNTGANFFTGTNASDIGVNGALANDPTLVQASGTPGNAGDNSVALAVAQLGSNNFAGLNNQSFSQNWAQTVGNFGDALSSVNQQVTNSSSVTQMLTNQRQSVSGVSIDDEMTSIMEYQKAYEASAELISTVNQMLQTVVSMKTT